MRLKSDIDVAQVIELLVLLFFVATVLYYGC